MSTLTESRSILTGIKSYIDWLCAPGQWSSVEDADDIRKRHGDPYRGYVRQLIEDVKAGRMKASEAKQRRFIFACLTAHHATRFVLKQKISTAQLNYLYSKAVSGQAGVEFCVPAIDEIKPRLVEGKELNDKLKGFIGDLSEFVGTEEFHWGVCIGFISFQPDN